MDFAAATPTHPAVVREMMKGIKTYANPSAPHQEAREARALVEDARIRIARVLSAKPEHLYFTGGGTEANNLAVHGAIEALIIKGAKPEDLHIIASGFEHPSLGDPVAAWTRRGVKISLVEPNEEGIITPEAIKKLLRPETALVSIVAVQSEIGQIQPLKDISRVLAPLRDGRAQTMQHFFPETAFPIFHTDASQSSLYVDVSPDRLGVDMATYGAQKILGPKGVGLLYKKSTVTLDPGVRGGRQERGLRPGTENLSGILGMAKAFELAIKGREARVKRVTAVRNYFVSLLQKELPEIEVNGGMKHRIANNLNISVPGADGDYLAVLMDKEGVAVSARSACIASSGTSKAVAALGKGEKIAMGTLRFSFGPHVTKREVRRAVNALKASLKVIENT